MYMYVGMKKWLGEPNRSEVVDLLNKLPSHYTSDYNAKTSEQKRDYIISYHHLLISPRFIYCLGGSVTTPSHPLDLI